MGVVGVVKMVVWSDRTVAHRIRERLRMGMRTTRCTKRSSQDRSVPVPYLRILPPRRLKLKLNVDTVRVCFKNLSLAPIKPWESTDDDNAAAV